MFYRSTRKSDRCALIDIELILIDSIALHKWADGGSPVSEFRQMLVELVARILRMEPDPGIRLQVAITHAMIPEGGGRRACFTFELDVPMLARWSTLSRDRLMQEIAARVPTFVRHARVPAHEIRRYGKSRRIAPGNPDRRVLIALGRDHPVNLGIEDGLTLFHVDIGESEAWKASDFENGARESVVGDSSLVSDWVVRRSCRQVGSMDSGVSSRGGLNLEFSFD